MFAFLAALFPLGAVLQYLQAGACQSLRMVENNQVLKSARNFERRSCRWVHFWVLSCLSLVEACVT